MGSRYTEMEIRTASPEMLVVKMYEGAIRFTRRARESHNAGRVAERGAAISRALAIVSELQNCLNFDQGGEISRNLESLYLFVTDRLLEANMRGRAEALEEALGVLGTLSEAWVEIARSPAGSQAGLDLSQRAAR